MEHISSKRTHFRDPFGRDPPPKAFYHPSKQNTLKKREREIALSPERHDSRSRPQHSPGDRLFLKGTNVFSIQTPPNKDHSDDHSSHFDESWPNSERPSYTSVADSENVSPVSGRPSDMVDSLAYLKSTLDMSDTQNYHLTRDIMAKSQSRDNGANKGPVLQSYIERFRHGAPMSREERSRIEHSGKQDFWWLSQNPPTPSDTSTPKDDDKPRSRQFTDQGKAGVTSYNQTNSLPLTAKTLQALSTQSVDEKTRRLQERADRLLEESSSSLRSSEPAVSTDGLGASSSGTVISFEEIPYRPVFTRNLDPSQNMTESRFTVSHDVKPGVSVPRRPLKPDEDILYQWRLRRKMEVAQHSQGVKVAASFPKKDIDSKLDAFRRRLDGTLNPTAEVRSSGALHFTPAPLPSTCDIKMVNAEAQTRESLEDTNSSPTKDVRTPPRSRIPSKPEIASPTLSRDKQQSPMKTDPHLHLMCDILPCPHAEKYAQKFTKLYQTSSDFSETEGSSLQESHVQYKQYLQAEKPHTEERRRKRKEHSRYSKERQDHETDERIGSDVLLEIDDSSNMRTNGPDMSEARPSDLNKQTDVKEGRHLRHVSGKESVQNGDRKKVRISEQVDLVDRRLTKERQVYLDERRFVESESERRDYRGRQSRGDPGEGDKCQTGGKKTVTKSSVPRPVHSSSPARQPQSVSSAIGQTISEHLFDGSASAVISSVDSWASLTDHTHPPPSPPVNRTPVSHGQGERDHSHPHPSPPVHRPPVSHGQGERDTETLGTDDQEADDESCQSDGEFPDDHILTMLRQQRTEYEIKLQQIDDLLQQSSFGQK